MNGTLEALVPVLSSNGTGRPVAALPASSWEPVSDFAVALEPPAPPVILNGPDGALLYLGRRHLLWGAPEALKSWLALAAVAEIIQDGHCAAFIDADEMGLSAVVDRLCMSLGVSMARVEAGLLYIAPETRFDERADLVVARLVQERAPVLAVIDAMNPALALQGLSSNSTDEVQEFLRTVVGAWHRRGVATLVVDHVTKGGEIGRHSIGSERKLSGVDVSISAELIGSAMTRANPRAAVTLKAAKDRPAWHNRGPKGVIGTFEIDLDRSPKWSLNLALAGVGQGAVEEMARRVGQVMGQNPNVSQAECARILDVKRDNGTFRRGWAMARANPESGPGGPTSLPIGEVGPAHASGAAR